MLDRLIKSDIAFGSETSAWSSAEHLQVQSLKGVKVRSTELSLKWALSNQMSVYQLLNIFKSLPLPDERSISRARVLTPVGKLS
jgi:hypothetical protein